MNIKSSAASHIGMIRTENEDAYLEDLEEKLFIVADGMGGAQGGAFASKKCVEICQKYLREHWSKERQKDKSKTGKIELLSKALQHANTSIYETARSTDSLEGMGTTVTMLKIEKDRAYLAHVGDSRLYLLRENKFQQLTRDHTLPQEQLRLGQITQEEFVSHTLHHVLIRALGIKKDILIDTQKLELKKEDIILLCSDGLYNTLLQDEIKTVLEKKNINSVDSLIKLANDRGGQDNITAIFIQLV